MRLLLTTLVPLALAAGPALAQTYSGAGADPQTNPTPGQQNSTPTQSASTPDLSGPAAPPKAITVTGGVTLISDYRFRGLTQTDGGPAIQGTLNVNTAAGPYVGVWASSIDGSNDGSTPALAGYGDEEVDLYGGFTKSFHGLGVDAGLLYYYYASHRSGQNTDFFEPYASLSYTLGPVAAKVGAAYAWAGQKGLDFRPNNSDDDLYVYAEGSLGVPHTPVTLKGHFGRTDGSLGLVNYVASDDTYYDWSVTAEAVGGPLKVGVSYVDTDISEAKGTYTKSIATTRYDSFARFYGRGSTVLAYVGVTF